MTVSFRFSCVVAVALAANDHLSVVAVALSPAELRLPDDMNHNFIKNTSEHYKMNQDRAQRNAFDVLPFVCVYYVLDDDETCRHTMSKTVADCIDHISILPTSTHTDHI